MQKPQSLRLALNAMFPSLQANPELLQSTIKKGVIASTLATSLSFEYQYKLVLSLNNFSDNLDTLFVTILSWLRTHQPDLMTREAMRNRGFRFNISQNTDGTTAVRITLKLTERNWVREENESLYLTYEPEPTPPEPVTRPMSLYINGNLISQWSK
ncbi:phage tail protein [Prodigiosinella confusarubida]|uniref:Phage tail protein n=1 Tax=Serratia sp. (strain ATCC 39006) TaxID=104623 RepID=A0A2I5T8T3_SERS3|nr:phage tail protein [Serratia sp. ATCC 39006]AUH00978.1 phage tail protein [Serratia sp. ATCC 39006]AUH05299.1 phage tail protein [Serratia sp. ATCC 39006]